LRTLVNLPNGNGKKVKVAVLCEESKIKEAKDSGAEIAGFDNLVNDITNGKINFDKLIATPATMSKIGKLGKILGPKGLMPNPKFGTVSNDIKTSVKAIKNGQIEIKNDKDGNIAASIGKKSFTDMPEKSVCFFQNCSHNWCKEDKQHFKDQQMLVCLLLRLKLQLTPPPSPPKKNNNKQTQNNNQKTQKL